MEYYSGHIISQMKYSLLEAYEEIQVAGTVDLLVLQSTVMHKAVLQLKKKLTTYNIL